MQIIIEGSVKFNRFVDFHVKSIVDRHFGFLSKLFKQKEKEFYINNISELKSTFEEGEERKGLFKSSINNSEVSQKTFFIFMIEVLEL